ncbi:MAG: Arm DNA-binding domain-containing protein, partial [Clostridia bacterium]|nr:Arm DNA-binding domain-containing protein [Clostridia bacterium]
MASIKKDDNGRWTVQYRYTDWQGVRRKSTKRGFKTKHEAEDWFNNYMLVKDGNLDMDFESFVNIYLDSVKQRIRESTWINKEYIINIK